MSTAPDHPLPAGWTHWIVTGWPLWKVLVPAVGVPAVIIGSQLYLYHLWGAPPLPNVVQIAAYSILPVFLAVVLPVQRYLEGPHRVGLSARGVTVVTAHYTETVPWERVDPPSYSRPANARSPNPHPYHLNFRDPGGTPTSMQFATYQVVRELMDFPGAPPWRHDPALRARLQLPAEPPGPGR